MIKHIFADLLHGFSLRQIAGGQQAGGGCQCGAKCKYIYTQKYLDLSLILDNLYQISDYDYFLTYQDDSMVQNKKSFENFAKVKNVKN